MPLSFRLIIPWPWYPSSKVMMIGRCFERSRTSAFVSLLIVFVSLVIFHCYPFCLFMLLVPRLPIQSMPRHYGTYLCTPAQPRLSKPCLAPPFLACRSVTVLSSAGLAIRILSLPALPCQASPGHAVPCLPCHALPSLTPPCHAMFTRHIVNLKLITPFF